MWADRGRGVVCEPLRCRRQSFGTPLRIQSKNLRKRDQLRRRCRIPTWRRRYLADQRGAGSIKFATSKCNRIRLLLIGRLTARLDDHPDPLAQRDPRPSHRLAKIRELQMRVRVHEAGKQGNVAQVIGVGRTIAASDFDDPIINDSVTGDPDPSAVNWRRGDRQHPSRGEYL